jgi:murein DD-endopeptidase MepM/ murein hydrolase activator NlpD
MSGSEVSRRTALLGAAATAIAGVVGLSRRSTATAATATTPALTRSAAPGAAPNLPIEQSATGARPAKRLRQMGSLMFPMGPEPRCDILDNFGDPRSGGRHHEGIDLLSTLGQEVYAVVDGTLTKQAGADSSLSGNAWGLTATVGGTYYFYAHLSAFAAGLSLGDRVAQGQIIGYVGDTGNPGPGNYHLHFEVHPGGQLNAAVNPLPLLEVPTVCTVT